jgi:two-component system OmpR family response regulator
MMPKLKEQAPDCETSLYTRAMPLDAAWDDDFDPGANIIDMHMHRLRAKVDQGGETPLIHTVAGAGYCIRTSPP